MSSTGGPVPLDPDDVVAAELGDLVVPHAPLAPLTTYRVGGAARWLATVGSDDELQRAAEVARRRALPVLVVGKGSNLLVADTGFDGLAVQLAGTFAEVAIEGTTVRAGGAALLPVVARRTAAAGLTGFEWAVGVPGSVGGAVRMNAGGHGSDVAASLVRVRVVDLAANKDGAVPTAALELQYRSSAVAAHQVVAWAELELAPGDVEAAEAEISEIVRWRRANQPGGQNAGSVFTNPPGDSAGRLIDAAGAKGLRVGTAEVSTKHANFIQADPGGRAQDVWDLMVEVRRRVHLSSGTVLHPETRLVGFGPMADPA
ncbi:UDP-N-acetylmuramate dehydrogenase [Aquihabitans sp. G128]|uniref:UDP-N-acetylmuramate dehydrogenase n=1 Tax=Aquihabitans sp. G128 TaxID=2849779 RepID=UPI001C2489B1|nr:UDP-N-acetylmuramate dehydrogenase [Aquihabitans sp. G128]QXC62269.1 UDP-N-acetylmuramate dehydrogenase [Aquihabitans sp. G128]